MNSMLAVSYLGIELSSPVIVGSCPLTTSPELTRQMVDAGAGAVALPSILQEQLEHFAMKRLDPIGAIEKCGHTPQQDRYNGGPEVYLETIQQMKVSYSLPVIAGIHGVSTGPWLDYAKQIQSSGADALELNWQAGRCDPNETGAQIESRLIDWVAAVRAQVTIPIAVKLSDRFCNLASVALRLRDAGVNGLILFAHRPQWDVDTDRMHWTIGWDLTPVGSLGKTLEGLVAVNSPGLKHISLAASGGVRTGNDVVKAILAGADVAMIVSEVYRQGPGAIRDINAGIRRYLEAHHFSSLRELQNARPSLESKPDYSMRTEIVDPLTCTTHFYDPTPVARQISGDPYGHPSV